MATKTAIRHLDVPRCGADLPWLLAFVLPMLLLRAAALAGGGAAPAWPDLRGLLSDIGMGLLVASASAAVARANRWAGVALAVAWALFGYGNYEHVKVHSANVSAEHAAYLVDPTFLFGSALRSTSPAVFLAVLLLAAVPAMIAARSSTFRPGLVRPAVAGLVALVATLVWPPSLVAPAWRQAHFVPDNLSRLAGRAGASAAVNPPGRDRRLRADLDGEPWTDLGRRGHNVLLVLVEAISGAHLPSVAGANGASFPLELPHLDRVARDNVSYTSFIAHQRMTNRGEYALLCGDYPKLTTEVPKMTEYVLHGGPACLPAVLAEAGYRTVYLQAAPMPFMLKDQFMPAIGFQRLLGDESFVRARKRTLWGVDDRTFFEAAVGTIEELERGEAPWFLTLLTVGTHHPHIVPDEYEPPGGETGFARAAIFADEAFGEFMRAVEASGIRENTLILVTSDESAGVSGRSDLGGLITQSWGVMIALLPTGESKRIDDPFMQLDVPLSILDYLGIPADRGTIGGRSLFRRYEGGRVAAFANTYSHIVGGLNEEGRLYICREGFGDCFGWEMPDASPFRSGGRRIEGEIDPAEIAFLKEVVERSRHWPAKRGGPSEMELVAQRRVPLRDGVSELRVFAGQFLALEPGSRIEVDIDVVLRGEDGMVDLHHDLISEGGQTHFDRLMPAVRSGERASIHYSFQTAGTLDRMECRLIARRRLGRELALEFSTARIRLVPPVAGARPRDDRLEIRELAVTAAAP